MGQPPDYDPAIPEMIAALADREMAVMDPAAADFEQFDYDRHPIGQNAGRRLRSLLRAELEQQPRIITPRWTQERAIPALIVTQRWAGGDAFGCARQISELDIALRRATALVELYLDNEPVEQWPRPVRPERGGLWLLDASYGSLDALWSVYGALVIAATSTPVSLASFASLAWQTSKFASRMARRWVVRPLGPREVVDRPRAADSNLSAVDREETWQERTTKRVIPILKQAVEDGYGVDFRATGPSGEVRLTVAPRAELENPEPPGETR